MPTTSARRLSSLRSRSSGILDRRYNRPSRSCACGERHLLQRQVLGGMVEALRLEPLAVPGAPGLLARICPAALQHHGRDRLPLAAQVVHRRFARPHQLAHRLVRLIGHPHRRQLARQQQTCELERAAPVRLDRSPSRVGISDGATTVQV